MDKTSGSLDGRLPSNKGSSLSKMVAEDNSKLLRTPVQPYIDKVSCGRAEDLQCSRLSILQGSFYKADHWGHKYVDIRQLLEGQSSELVSFCILILLGQFTRRRLFFRSRTNSKWNWVLRARARQIAGILHERSAKFLSHLSLWNLAT